MFQYSIYPPPIYVMVFTVIFWCWSLFEMWVFWRDRARPETGRLGSRAAVIVALG